MHTSFEYRGRRMAITKDRFGWHVQTPRRVVSRRLLVDALEEALPESSRPERDRLTVVLLEGAAKAAARTKAVSRSHTAAR